ncbi:MAG: 5-formyltetrahydrofolate cyclo-ligase [Eggerthellaceae bacterium]|nr:5-formyltetrahydrofolate cyclo-ligase [Eggerthellaceae bacterium]
MHAPIDATKSTLRAPVIAARDAVDEVARARKSRAICDALENFAETVAADRTGLTVTAFCAMGSEVDVSAFVAWAFERGWRVAYPCMLKRSEAAPTDAPGLPVMRFRYITADQLSDDADAFFKHPMKSYASTDPLLVENPLCNPEDVDLVVAPMVAFDDRNYRLGYGGGCYDRFLPRLSRGASIAGVAFKEQRVDRVPTDEHDVQLPRIFTA